MVWPIIEEPLLSRDVRAGIGPKSIRSLRVLRLLSDIDARSIQAYQQRRLSQGAQGRTINIEIGVLRQILKAYECWRPIEGRVRTLRERKDIGRALLPDEERRLLGAAQSLDSACYTAVVLALNTAMRHSEFPGLRWRQIDFAQRLLTVGQSKTAAGTGRLIPLNTPAFDALVKWAGRSPQTVADHYVFPWCENRQIDTCITKMAESQTPDLVIMSVAGHVSRAMLEHYSRIRTEAKRAALERLAQPSFVDAVNQNVHQPPTVVPDPSRNLLN